MKKWLLFLLLVNHINTTMFFPVIEEPVLEGRSLGYYDETNSIVEWFKKDVLGLKNKFTGDEDEDQPICLLVKSISYAAFTVVQNEVKLAPVAVIKSVAIPVADITKLQKGHLSRFSPPPDFA